MRPEDHAALVSPSSSGPSVPLAAPSPLAPRLVPIRSRGTFAALRYRNFRYFWIGQCVSLLGTWMQRAAQIWLVYKLTDSPFLTGILGVAQSGPMLAFSLFAGSLVDRLPKRKLLIVAQTA